ncbi:MAG: hypothetical protein HYT16_04040 [DPANN group archaeon]|nr:hypothetical protein [DPANN group archaeon]
MAAKIFEEQTNKGFELLGAIGRVISYKCNNCNYQFKFNTDLKQALLCPTCGNTP